MKEPGEPSWEEKKGWKVAKTEAGHDRARLAGASLLGGQHKGFFLRSWKLHRTFLRAFLWGRLQNRP